MGGVGGVRNRQSWGCPGKGDVAGGWSPGNQRLLPFGGWTGNILEPAVAGVFLTQGWSQRGPGAEMPGLIMGAVGRLMRTRRTRTGLRARAKEKQGGSSWLEGAQVSVGSVLGGSLGTRGHSHPQPAWGAQRGLPGVLARGIGRERGLWTGAEGALAMGRG